MKGLVEYINESRNNFSLTDDERRALSDFIGNVTGNLGDSSDIKRYDALRNELDKDSLDMLNDIYDFLENDEVHRKVNNKTLPIKERELIKQCYDWANDKGYIDEQWDLMDAVEKFI